LCGALVPPCAAARVHGAALHSLRVRMLHRRARLAPRRAGTACPLHTVVQGVVPLVLLVVVAVCSHATHGGRLLLVVVVRVVVMVVVVVVVAVVEVLLLLRLLLGRGEGFLLLGQRQRILVRNSFDDLLPRPHYYHNFHFYCYYSAPPPQHTRR